MYEFGAWDVGADDDILREFVLEFISDQDDGGDIEFGGAPIMGGVWLW